MLREIEEQKVEQQTKCNHDMAELEKEKNKQLDVIRTLEKEYGLEPATVRSRSHGRLICIVMLRKMTTLLRKRHDGL